MKHMPGYDSVVSAYWDEGGDEGPVEALARKLHNHDKFHTP